MVANVRLPFIMHTLMFLQARILDECVVAKMTLVGSLSCVRSHVLLQRLLASEHLEAVLEATSVLVVAIS